MREKGRTISKTDSTDLYHPTDMAILAFKSPVKTHDLVKNSSILFIASSSFPYSVA